MLLDPMHTIGGSMIVTTDEFVNSCGGVGICYETGQADDMSLLPSVRQEIAALLLSELDIEIGAEKATASSEKASESFLLTESIIYDKTFQWDARVARANFECIPAGTTLHGTKETHCRALKIRTLYSQSPIHCALKASL